MLSEIRIRQAVRADLPALIDLYQHLTPGDERPGPTLADDILERLHAFRGSMIVVAEIDGVLVASCTLIVIPNFTRGGTPYALIENVVTHRSFRNRGLGKQVLAYACDAAWDAGCYKIMLMTGSSKPEVLQFYLSAGFEQSKIGFQMRRMPVREEG